MSEPEPPQGSQIDLSEVQRLTPRALFRLASRLTIGSWLMVTGLVTALVAGALGLGWSYRDGSLLEVAYVFHQGHLSPREVKEAREQQEAFETDYSDLVDWSTLQAIVSGIEVEKPDGLNTRFKIAASLLAQVRATRGSASFLAGNKEITVHIERSTDGFDLEWESKPSIVRRIAGDAGYTLSDKEMRLVNSELNLAQFSYFDEAMEHAVIHREVDGNFGLVIQE